jgi:cephalosporin hydroxylase
MKIRTLAVAFLTTCIALSPACKGRKKAPAATAATAADTTPAAGQPEGEKPTVFELTVANPAFQDRLLRGFFDGNDAWKWTGKLFAVSLDAPPPLDAPTTLTLDFNAPDELMNVVKEVTLTARVNGQSVGSKKYISPGRYYLELSVPPALLKKTPAEIEFELDHAAKDPATGRELGLIVVNVSLNHPDATVLDRNSATTLAHAGYLQMLRERKSKLPVEKQNDLMKLFHDMPVWSHMWFENVPIEKSPLDLWMMQQIIYETRPDFIIETGTFKGGSALYWAYTLNGMGLENSRVFTSDIQDLTATAATNPLWKKYVNFFKASSTAPEVVAEISKRAQGHKVLITLDSDHSEAHVSEEIKAYAPMVSRGSYLVVEDTHMDGVPTAPGFGPGPMAAVQKFLKAGGSKDFEQDSAREAFIMTFNPGGWLKRR